MKICYPALLTHTVAGVFRIQFVDLLEAFSDGDTPEQALHKAADALTLAIEHRITTGVIVPAPTQDIASAYYIAPDAKTQSALLLSYARGERTFSELARALETSWPQARRLEDPTHWPSLKTLDRVARVLGKRLVLSME